MKASGRQPPGKVRIIAGRWRNTRLPVPDRPGLRPTADRVRETLFNWLQPVLPGARVLDLFAGTGALGFEAGSRGAAEVVMVERDPELAASLRGTAARLKAGNVTVECADALAWLRRPSPARFDLVFLDPPFAAGLWTQALDGLVPWLAPGARVYVESPADDVPSAPPGWLLLREGRTREVRYALYRLPDGAPATLTPAHDPKDAPTA
ncbi:16S rRNA (guanine(966)-N(2))-methyltransferase RsmD [Rehaibacterium terrae]|uniref:16S rRNA (guanine(966)-N(2))-methyltransferase RsmD n=1 Tax=Rehaibacterium terrae TaxID=1341696 RepID=UPI00391D06E3